MPSPIGHALAGLAVTRAMGGPLKENWPYVVLAASADLDIVLNVLRNRPVDYTCRRSHSLGAAVAAGALAGGVASLHGRRALPSMIKGTAAYASHLVLDYFGKEAQSGLPVFWPASTKRFASPRPVFATMYSASQRRYFRGLITHRNLRRVVREVAILSPAVLGAHLLRMGYRSLTH